MAIAVEAAAAGRRIIWGAPTFDQVRIGWEETRRAAGGVAQFKQSEMVALFPGGGAILYRSLDDPDNARGHTADGLVIDEAADVNPAAYYEVLRPMLLDTSGWAWMIGTPKGRNWFWQEFEKSRDDADAMAWTAPTLGCEIRDGALVRVPHPLENPHIQFSEIEKLWAMMPERSFRQEILAEFIDDAGGVFRRVRDAATLSPRGPEAGHQYIIGCDWGKMQDWTVLTILDDTTGEHVYLDRFNQIDYELQRVRLQAACERYKPWLMVAERNSMGEPIIDAVQRQPWAPRRIEAFQTTQQSKAQAVDALALALEKGEIKLLNNPTLVGELQAYEATRLPAGGMRYGAPQGMHDDCVMSLMLAWWGHAYCHPATVKVSKNPFYA